MLARSNKFAPTVQSLFLDQYLRMLSDHDEHQQQTSILRCSMLQQLFVVAVYRIAMNYRPNMLIKDSKVFCQLMSYIQDIYRPIVQDCIATHFDNLEKLVATFTFLGQIKAFSQSGTNGAAFHSPEQQGLAQIDSSIFSDVFNGVTNSPQLPPMFKLTSPKNERLEAIFYPNYDIASAVETPEAHVFHNVLFKDSVD